MALAALHMGEILAADELPLRYAGFSTCFRREAGAAGKDTRGMFRVHQFNKVEMFVFTPPGAVVGASTSVLVELEEAFVQELGLPYRVVNVAAGDLGASAAKKIRHRGLVPAPAALPRGRFVLQHDGLPGSSADIRYRPNGGPQPVHTLNGTMVTDRWLLAILENFGGEVPDALQPFGAPERVER